VTIDYEYRRKNRITLPKFVGICFIDSISQQRNQMPNFLIDLLRVINGPSNLLAEEFPVSPPQPMYCNAHRTHADLIFSRNLSVRNRTCAARQKYLQFLKKIGFLGPVIFLSKPFQHLLEYLQSPAPLKKKFRRNPLHRFGLVAPLWRFIID